MKVELKNLFSPYRMKNLTIKNRFVRSPMESSLGFQDGLATNDHLRMYRTAAEGGVGLMIVEGVAVHPISKMTDAQMTAFGEESIPGFTKLANTIHAHGDGVVLWAQLYCGGAASFGYSYGQDDYGLDVNTFKTELIKDILKGYANAALILQKSGFDGVEIHGGHGYLVSQFLSPAVNQRMDEWGGTPEKRMRFPLEILRLIREKCGDDFPVGIKMNTADFLPEGNWLPDTVKIARAFAEAGYDFIEASGGMGFMTELREALRDKMGNHEYYFKECIPAFREVLSGTGCALCITGGIGSPKLMEEMLESGVDFIGLARPWLTEPDLANRIKAGDHRDVRCVSREHICNLCLTRLALGPVTCYKFFPGYCKMECPIDQDAPDYIGQIAQGNFDEAFYSILRDNPLPQTLCRVCSHSCESVCRGKTGEPLAIRDLKRFAVEYGVKNRLILKQTNRAIPFGAKVAIIGAGPAGMTCGWDLARRGYRPVIFEKGSVPGGALAAIPRFRLPETALSADMEYVQSLGAEIRTGVEIGKDCSVEDLLAKDFEAVFIATGATVPVDIQVKGRELSGVKLALPYLLGVNQGVNSAIGKQVLVIGGGSVAFDAAMTARKAGSEVTLVSLEQREEMPAEVWEIEEALAEGVTIVNGRGVSVIEGETTVTGVLLKKCTAVFDTSGKFSPVFDETDEISIPADAVLLAIGQKPDISWIDRQICEKVFPDGQPAVDEITLATDIPGIFVGGDVRTGSKTVVAAMQEGKDAAESIDRYLRGVSLVRAPKDDTYEPFFKGAAAYADPSRQIQKSAASLRQTPGKDGVFTAEQAVKEARRCLKYDADLESESAARYANMGKAQIDFRKLSGQRYREDKS